MRKVWKEELVNVHSKKIGFLPNPQKRFWRCLKVSKGVESSKKRIKISTKPFSAVRNLKKGFAGEGSSPHTRKEPLKVS
jgi:hypothetical protein